jgi:ketosteroid isomerase-like protein
MSNVKDIGREALRRIDTGDFDGLLELTAPDVEWVTSAGRCDGKEQIQAFLSTYRAAFPDSRHELELVESAGDTAVIEGFWCGTNTGALCTPDGELPPTGAAARVRFAALMRVGGGRLASVHVYFDQLELLGQLGLVPEPAVA